MFQVLGLSLIHSKCIRVPKDIKCLNTLSKNLIDILNVAERYQVKQLVKEVETAIARFHIKTESNIHEPIKNEMENISDDPLRIENTFGNVLTKFLIHRLSIFYIKTKYHE